MTRPYRLLFVCVENANRSQMAAAFARMHGGADVEVHSAGSAPSGIVDRRAVEAMAERGYDLSDHTGRSLADIPDVLFDFVATMGCGDACPHVQARIREDWDLPDPKGQDMATVRRIRDDIEARVKALLSRLGSAGPET